MLRDVGHQEDVGLDDREIAVALARLAAAGIPVPKVLVTAGEVEAGKPDPAGYLRGAAALGVDPADAVVLEDAPPGVEAGLAAGMTAVGVLTTNGEPPLRDAHRRVRDLRTLLPDRAGGAAPASQAEPLPSACGAPPSRTALRVCQRGDP